MPAFRLSGTNAFGTPPIAPNAFTCAPIQSAASRSSAPRRRCSWTRRAPRRRCARDAPAGRGFEHRHGVAGPVDEQLLAGHMRLPHRRRDALAPVAVPLAEPAVGVALACSARYSCQSKAASRRAASAPHGCGTNPAAAVPASRRSRRRKQPPLQLGIVDLSGIGQLMPLTAARRTYSPTVDRPTPVAIAICRPLMPSACLSRSTSRTFLIGALSAGIGPPIA